MPRSKPKALKKYMVRGSATVRFEITVEAESKEDAEQHAHDIGPEELAADHAVGGIDTDVDEVEPVEE